MFFYSKARLSNKEKYFYGIISSKMFGKAPHVLAISLFIKVNTPGLKPEDCLNGSEMLNVA